MPTVHSRPIVVPDPDPSLNWVVTYQQGIALQIVLVRTRDLLVSVETSTHQGLYKIRWPLDKNGNRVPPEEIHRYLKARYVTWKCFCVDQYGSRRVRFTTKPDGMVMVYCGHIPSRCPYQLNLSKIYRRAEIDPSKYERYPTSFDRVAYSNALHHLTEIVAQGPHHHHHHHHSIHGGDHGQAVEAAEDGAMGGQASAGTETSEDPHSHDDSDGDSDSDIDDNWDWGVHECCGEAVDDPNEFVVPILDGWLGFGARNPGDYSSMLEWAPGKFGWSVQDN
ncbi:hypothetical protein MD484_g7876, partial [Candolleomyces efflorescens]